MATLACPHPRTFPSPVAGVCAHVPDVHWQVVCMCVWVSAASDRLVRAPLMLLSMVMTDDDGVYVC